MKKSFFSRMSPFFQEKNFSEFHAINDSSFPLKKRNKLKLNLGMYSSINEEDIVDDVDLIKYFILKQDILALETCFDIFEKRIFVAKKKKLIVLKMLFPYFRERVIEYAKKNNIYYILSYIDPKYIKYNKSFDRYLLKMNSSVFFDEKVKIFNEFMRKQDLSEIIFKDKKFCLASMCGVNKKQYFGKKVSIILTVYNGSEYIRTSIESILNQDYKNFELIVVDDASDDNTVEILKKYQLKDNRVAVIFLKKNVGTYKAKNIALKYANGEYIAFQDADDYSHTSRISSSISLLESKPGLSAVSSRYVRINNEGQFVSSKGIPLIRWSPLTLVFHRIVIDHLIAFDEVRFGADSEFFSRYIAKFGHDSHVILDKVLMFCLDRDNSLMKNNIEFFGFSKPRNVYQDLYNHRILNNLDRN